MAHTEYGIHPLESEIHIRVNTPGSENSNLGWDRLYQSKIEECLKIIAEAFSEKTNSLVGANEHADYTHIMCLINATKSGSITAKRDLLKMVGKGILTVCINYDGDGLLGKNVKSLDHLPPATKATFLIALFLEDLRITGVPIEWCVHDVQFNEWQEPISKYLETHGMPITLPDGLIKLIPIDFWDRRIFHTAYFKKGDERYSPLDCYGTTFGPSFYEIEFNYIGKNIEIDQGAWCKKYGGWDFEKNEAMGSTAAHQNVTQSIIENNFPTKFYSVMAYDEELTGKTWEKALVGSSIEKAIKLGLMGNVELRYVDATLNGDGWSKRRDELPNIRKSIYGSTCVV